MNSHEIQTLWKLLAQTWGARFLEQYGPTPNEAWSSALAHVQPESARFALGGLIQAGSGFPPTLPEFVAMARTHVREEARRANAASMVEHVTPCDPEVARQNIARLRALLRSN